MNQKDVQLSKSLSWLLRHGALREGFDISPEGYIEVNRILEHKSFRGYTRSDIERVVASNEKQRFKLRVSPVGVVEIKANQGHSISAVTNTELTPILEVKYKTIVHGTYHKCWPRIKNEGLSRMNRKHIHFAKGTPQDQSVISGIRNNIQIYIFIDLYKALNGGIKFYESENGVILTEGNEKGYLESKYFSKVIVVATGEQLYP